MGLSPFVVVLIVIVLIILFLISNIKIVPQAQEYVIERLGTYYASWGTGVHFLTPFVDRVAKRVSIKEQVVDFAPQPVITKDNVVCYRKFDCYYSKKHHWRNGVRCYSYFQRYNKY